MKRLLLSACLCALSGSVLAADLHIKAGSTYVVDASQAKLSLDNLTIDDKAKIKLGSGVDLWVVNAKNASIGYGVAIDGSGDDGRDGANGLSHREATSCAPGQTGGEGQLGAAGGNGASVHWNLGVASFGSVKVDLSGGYGGRGGVGGDGQNVPDFSNCTAAGGNAGNGGNGGSGGKGGSFRFHYTLSDDVAQDLTNSIEVKISGGLRGKGGQAGLQGVGTSGRYINKKSLAGNRSWSPGGGDGSAGDAGRSGTSGGNGSLDIRRINGGSADAQETPAPEEAGTQVNSSLQERIEELEVLTQKLEARIRLLELDKR